MHLVLQVHLPVCTLFCAWARGAEPWAQIFPPGDTLTLGLVSVVPGVYRPPPVGLDCTVGGVWTVVVMIVHHTESSSMLRWRIVTAQLWGEFCFCGNV